MKKVENVIYPKPPICISVNITNLPNKEKYVPVSRHTRPVTQVAEVAVKSEFAKFVSCPFAEENGRDRSTVPVSITRRKLKTTINEGLNLNIYIYPNEYDITIILS